MKAYILTGKENRADRELFSALRENGAEPEELELPGEHKDIPETLKGKESGIIFLPTMWNDLFSIKVLQEIEGLEQQFETVIVGPNPDVANLVAAFNEGLTAFLPTPIEKAKVKQALQRVSNRLKAKHELRQERLRLAEYESGGVPSLLSAEMQERDIFVARAYLDAVKNRGVIAEGNASVLIVTTSDAQEKRLATFLKEIGIRAEHVSSMEEGIKKAVEKNYKLIISDYMLPDGDAVKLVEGVLKELKTQLPRFIVWSSSPEKISSLMDPENHIDYVILKPSPQTGMEMVLPSILAAIYSSDA